MCVSRQVVRDYVTCEAQHASLLLTTLWYVILLVLTLCMSLAMDI